MVGDDIPLFWPHITGQEIDAVTRVLEHGWLTQGAELRRLEQLSSQVSGRNHAVAVNSGTSALHLAMLAAGVQEGDEVITTPFSFVASANVILMVSAIPRMVDIDPLTLNLSPSLVESSITEKTKAILAVDVFGNLSHLAELERIAQQRNLVLIEDGCEALGSEKDERKAGGFGQCSAFGFFPNKQITSGEGGVLLTDDEVIYEYAASLRNHGRDAEGFPKQLGYNYKLNEVNAALANAQLLRLDEILAKRACIARQYSYELADLEELRIITDINSFAHQTQSLFAFVVELSPRLAARRDDVLHHLQSRGIGCGTYFFPLHLLPHIGGRCGYEPGDFPVCERVSSSTLALPFFTSLSPNQVSRVCETLKDWIGRVI